MVQINFALHSAHLQYIPVWLTTENVMLVSSVSDRQEAYTYTEIRSTLLLMPRASFYP